MTESAVVGLLLTPFLGFLALDVYFWFWKTKESSFGVLTFIVAIPIATNEIGWPVWLRWVFPPAVFVANILFANLVYRKGWRGVMARRHMVKRAGR